MSGRTAVEPAPGASGGRWRRALSLFDEVVDLPAAERGARIAAACAGDAALREEVERLLAADSTAESPLDRPAGELAADLPDPAEPSDDLRAGERVGPWRIERELGRGGMGRVYLASRSDGAYEQLVALKRTPPGLDSTELLGRFRRERRILARLAHRGIAHLVDGGVADDGKPYFAMEYVDGEPITRWCEARGADLRQVLLLFRQVCEAVRFAHAKLVVHRDLKPANILVSRDGQVKLLDFGIAKLLDPGEADASETRTIDRRLTPHYASPEQVRGEPASTATDVWALGVVLYELLAGARPFGRRAATLTEVQREVLERSPDPPGAVAAAARREGGTAPWRGRIPPDLDAIALRALRPDPEDRYASVEALVRDLDRFLDGRPVLAAHATTSYRLRKFVARNRAAVAIAVVAGLGVVAGFAGTAWQSTRARAEAARAREMAGFMTGLFRASDPRVARGDTLTARVLLEEGAARVERELARQPALLADMLHELATIQAQLGVYDRAESLYARAAELRARSAGRRGLARAASLAGLGAMQLERADYARAEATLREALEIAGTRPGGAATRAHALAALGGVWQAGGLYAPADSAFRLALALDERLHGRDSPEVAEGLDRLAGLAIARAEYRAATPLLWRVVDLQLRTVGRDHPATARSLERLADAIGYYGPFARAESLRREAITIRLRVLGPDHADLGTSLHDLAGLAIAQRRFATADSAYREAYRILGRALGPDHPRVGRVLNNHGFLDWRRGRYADAAARLARAGEILRARLGPDHDRVLMNDVFRAAVQRSLGRIPAAEALVARPLSVWRGRYGDAHAMTVFALAELAEVRAAQGRLAEAESLATRAVTVRRAWIESSPMFLCESLETLGRILRLRGRLAGAAAAYEEVIAISRARFDVPVEVMWPEALAGLGLAARAMHQEARAESLLAAAARGAARAYGPGDPRAAGARAALAAR